MGAHHHLFTIFFMCVVPYHLYAMEKKSSSVTPLLTLCKNKIITGSGNTYAEQCKDALNSITTISTCMDESFVEDFQRSFVRHHVGSLPCTTTPFKEQSPSILLRAHNTLYGILGKDIYMWDLSTKANDIAITGSKITNLHRGRYKKPQMIQCALASKDGSRLYTGADNGGIKIWNLQSDTCKYVTTLPGSFYKKTKSFSENNNGNLCSADIDGKVRIWDITTQSRIQQLSHLYSKIAVFKVLADEHMIYAGGQDLLFKNSCPIFIYDTRVEKCIDCTDSHSCTITHLAKSKKDMQFYSSSYDNTIRIWDMRTMKQSVHTLKSTDAVQTIEENKDGTLLYSCTDDGVCAWDITTDTPYVINKMTDDAADCMAQSDDGSQLFINTREGIKTLTSDCTFDTASEIINTW